MLDTSKSFGYYRRPLILGSELLPNLSWKIHRSLCDYYNGERERYGGRKSEGVGVMKDKEPKLEETDGSHTLGGDIKYT